MTQFLWGIFPYLAIVIFIVGHIYRYNTDQLSWTAKSSQFLENKSLRVGSMLFHVGIVFVAGGHVAGLLIPKSLLADLGVSDEMYHAGAVYIGGLAGIITLIGILVLLTRRITNERVRKTSDTSDIVTVILVFAIVAIGVYNTLIGNQINHEFDYRNSVSPWFRSLFTLNPKAALMGDVPLGFKLHVLFSFALLAIWPFTRLVHVWSVPLNYVKRSPLVYRKRA